MTGLTEIEHRANEEARHGNREALESAQKRIQELEAKLEAVKGAANALVDFHNLPAEAKRPDMHQRLIARLADALKEGETDEVRALVAAGVREGLEMGATACEEANTEIWEYSTGNRGRIGTDSNAEAIRATDQNAINTAVERVLEEIANA